MTKTEIETQVALGTYLPEMWKQRCKLHAESNKLNAESSKLHAEGDLLFINAVIEVYGKEITMEWTSTGCKLDNGMEFKND